MLEQGSQFSFRHDKILLYDTFKKQFAKSQICQVKHKNGRHEHLHKGRCAALGSASPAHDICCGILNTSTVDSIKWIFKK